MKSWTQILEEAEKLTNLKFHLIENKEVKIRVHGSWWWFSDADKEKFQSLVNSELDNKFLSIK